MTVPHNNNTVAALVARGHCQCATQVRASFYQGPYCCSGPSWWWWPLINEGSAGIPSPPPRARTLTVRRDAPLGLLLEIILNFSKVCGSKLTALKAPDTFCHFSSFILLLKPENTPVYLSAWSVITLRSRSVKLRFFFYNWFFASDICDISFYSQLWGWSDSWCTCVKLQDDCV